MDLDWNINKDRYMDMDWSMIEDRNLDLDCNKNTLTVPLIVIYLICINA